MAGGFVKMQPACARADALLLSRSPSGAKDQEQQVQLRQKLRELPALLRSGLTLRRKSSAAGGRIISRRISNPYLENPPSKIYGESASCAGRALRNVFILQASDLLKDRMSLMGLCRSTAAGVWQLLLNMGIVLSGHRELSQSMEALKPH
ncbi:rap guanine nucleotide exchange factor 5-like isoform X2 [Varanus komodoensis]|uniref:rap guanine nucleotide exchange factor 5-like isoform X2 n=1 Tax=Varanus komodoensis TaxID=61221 RepID=UPI001CF7D600|nr:rap guanine nucleotide exchange factor 5-like isoform X2 [Varanus komodoensis]XP_044306688.1 rap guanine nucleotide exchange factor 5-like isoform X2 [Varanus komodoensis]